MDFEFETTVVMAAVRSYLGYPPIAAAREIAKPIKRSELRRIGRGFMCSKAILAAAALCGLTATAQADDINTVGMRPQAWVADANTGCNIRVIRPSPVLIHYWSGGCKDGFASGNGVMTTTWNGKPALRYEGEMRDGYFDGQGTLIKISGSRDAGSTYHGEFRYSLMDGQGTLVWPSGDRYQGEFRNGVANGHGVKTWTDGTTYDGDWRDGHQTGHGVEETPADGTRYEGEWSNDRPNGYGSATFQNGEIVKGVWANGCFQGGRHVTISATMAECGF